ncbi:MAG TPA: glycosyltransferase, partial [Hanamia sp.]|nr:glycosyltransferase [Hanamia sp.]
EEVMVSVIMVTHNHEKYIEEAIHGVLMQECDFGYELIIANDHSTDKTGEVIQRILLENPKAAVINYLYRDANLGSADNFIDAIKQSKGAYISLCDGDDYWTDTLKLQKQVDFLEKNNEYSMVCHDALVIDEPKNSSYLYFTDAHQKQICSTKDIFGIRFCPTASMLFRKRALISVDFPGFKILAGDLFLQLLISLDGPIYRMYEVMSVYRMTSTGVTQTNKRDQKGLIRNRISLIKYIDEISHKKYHKYIRLETLLMRSDIDYLNGKSTIRILMLKIYRKALFTYRKRVFSS